MQLGLKFIILSKVVQFFKEEKNIFLNIYLTAIQILSKYRGVTNDQFHSISFFFIVNWIHVFIFLSFLGRILILTV